MSEENSAKTSETLLRFSELLDLPKPERAKAELRILEGLMAQAIRDKDWTGSLKIFESAHSLLMRNGR